MYRSNVERVHDCSALFLFPSTRLTSILSSMYCFHSYEVKVNARCIVLLVLTFGLGRHIFFCMVYRWCRALKMTLYMLQTSQLFKEWFMFFENVIWGHTAKIKHPLLCVAMNLYCFSIRQENKTIVDASSTSGGDLQTSWGRV